MTYRIMDLQAVFNITFLSKLVIMFPKQHWNLPKKETKTF